MKKLLTVLLTMSLVLALAACGAQPAENAPENQTGGAPVQSSAPASSGFPKGTITIVVCRGAGGSADTVARMYAPYLAEKLGCNVIVENVEGGSGKVGLSQVYRADPDGYTLVLGNFPSYVLTEVVEGGDVEYQMSGFEPIAGVSGKEGNVLIVPADSPYQSLEELVSSGANLKMAVTTGVSNSSLAQAIFLDVTKVDVTSIPYDSGNNCVTAVMGKEVDCAICSSTAAYTPAAEGTLRVLTTFGDMEDEKLEGVPTFASIYGEEYGYDVVMGILAPPETPEEILTTLRDAACEAAQDPAFAEAAGSSFSVVPRTNQELKEVIDGCYSLAEASKDLLG
nr:tripartite tricarboxylate transporter substrate binding protein [uncultured Oscillibacter sp.]